MAHSMISSHTAQSVIRSYPTGIKGSDAIGIAVLAAFAVVHAYQRFEHCWLGGTRHVVDHCVRESYDTMTDDGEV